MGRNNKKYFLNMRKRGKKKEIKEKEIKQFQEPQNKFFVNGEFNVEKLQYVQLMDEMVDFPENVAVIGMLVGISRRILDGNNPEKQSRTPYIFHMTDFTIPAFIPADFFNNRNFGRKELHNRTYDIRVFQPGFDRICRVIKRDLNPFVRYFKLYSDTAYHCDKNGVLERIETMSREDLQYYYLDRFNIWLELEAQVYLFKGEKELSHLTHFVYIPSENLEVSLNHIHQNKIWLMFKAAYEKTGMFKNIFQNNNQRFETIEIDDDDDDYDDQSFESVPPPSNLFADHGSSNYSYNNSGLGESTQVIDNTQANSSPENYDVPSVSNNQVKKRLRFSDQVYSNDTQQGGDFWDQDDGSGSNTDVAEEPWVSDDDSSVVFNNQSLKRRKTIRFESSSSESEEEDEISIVKNEVKREVKEETEAKNENENEREIETEEVERENLEETLQKEVQQESRHNEKESITNAVQVNGVDVNGTSQPDILAEEETTLEEEEEQANEEPDLNEKIEQKENKQQVNQVGNSNVSNAVSIVNNKEQVTYNSNERINETKLINDKQSNDKKDEVIKENLRVDENIPSQLMTHEISSTSKESEESNENENENENENDNSNHENNENNTQQDVELMNRLGRKRFENIEYKLLTELSYLDFRYQPQYVIVKNIEIVTEFQNYIYIISETETRYKRIKLRIKDENNNTLVIYVQNDDLLKFLQIDDRGYSFFDDIEDTIKEKIKNKYKDGKEEYFGMIISAKEVFPNIRKWFWEYSSERKIEE